MTDSSGWWGDWRLVLVAALSVLSAGVVTVVVRDVDPATADTVVVSAVDAELVVDGRRVTAAEGDVVPPGATVVTGDGGGAAALETAGREVYLGAATTLGVVDGVQQSIERGLVMVDARDAAPLSLATPAGTVAVESGALARVENEVSLRLGVFEGTARMTALGRTATTTVDALHQLRTPYGGLPGTPTALALKGDRWEQQLAADLVAADTDLNGLAKGLENPRGLVVVRAATKEVRDLVDATRTTPGEKALAAAVAEAALDSPPDAASAVLAARREGGSWGVVAALVEARVSDVSAVLDRVLEPGTAPPLVAGPEPLLPGLLTPRPGSTGNGSTGSGGRPGGGNGPLRPSPTRSPSPSPSPSTSPSTTTAVDDVITAVQNLVSPSPSPAASARRGGILPFP